MRPAVGRAVLLAAALEAQAFFGCDPGGWKTVLQEGAPTLRAVTVTAKDRIYASGENGSIVTYDGASITDTSTDAGTAERPPTLYGVAVEDDGTLTVAGDLGLVLSRSSGVSGWRRERTDVTERLLMLMRAGPTSVFSAGDAGRVIRKTQGEEAWSAVELNAPSHSKITAGWADDDGSIVFTTDTGVVVERVQDQWVSQTVVTDTSSTPLPLFGVWSPAGGSELIAVGLSGRIYRREGRTAWRSDPTPVTQDLYGIFGTSRDRVFAVGAHGTILRFDGTRWTGVPSGTSNDLFSIHGLDDGSLTVAVGRRGTMVTLEEE